jgi:hypothetical protein
VVYDAVGLNIEGALSCILKQEQEQEQVQEQTKGKFREWVRGGDTSCTDRGVSPLSTTTNTTSGPWLHDRT